ncbi:hypothetical protein ACQ45_gp73 [Citrobacter phage Stevie]|uniref:Uncharacterized protein n=1 Tax=Citrobacter phage Stevie TaxID=2885922 RepID=A0A0A0YRE3_9CAUD|nr:hypothetical protein ACQ45_gp73 [Citrobacter phage Stevie]AIX12342.1 hypothetical protein CPT_Stevie73 [Citrobacter phage Stevie]WPK28045.1 hypothetical protein [Escherichia phage vB-Eco-KMB25]
MLTFILIAIVLILYVCGAFLMRALLKEADADDKDSWKPIILWPGYIIVPIYELIRDGEFKW